MKTMYQSLRSLLQKGYTVEFEPLVDGYVKLSVSESGNGSKKGISVEMGTMEWEFSEEGIKERLDEAEQALAPETV